MATDEPTPSDPNQQSSSPTDWTSASIADLIAHITTVHHARSRRLLRQAATQVRQLMMSRNTPGLPILLSAYQDFERDMLAHLHNEESVLFPACLALDRASHPGETPEGDIDVSHAIREMSTGHGTVHEDIGRLLGLAIDEPGVDERLTATAFRQSLIDLEEDLVEHGRLEEEILLPATMFQQELSHSRQAPSAADRPRRFGESPQAHPQTLRDVPLHDTADQRRDARP